MGQKLERLSEKDEESQENSDCSEQTAETQHSQTTEQDDLMTPYTTGAISGHAGEHMVRSACTVPQTGQPIRPLGQQEHPLDTRKQQMGGESEGWSVTRTVEGSKSALSAKETRHILNTKQGYKSTAVAFSRTAAMDEHGNGKKSEFGYSKLGPDSQIRRLTNPCNPTDEEEFVVLERDEAWASSEENNITFGNRINTENPQSSIRKRVEEDASVSHSDGNRPQPTTNEPEDTDDKQSRIKCDTLSEAHAESSPTACFEREMGQHLAELTGSRCQLKGVSHDRAAHTETARRGEAEREQNMNDHSKEQMRVNITKEHLSMHNDSRLVKRFRESSGDMENMHDRADITLQTQQADQSHQSRFAGAVSKRAKAGVTGTTSGKSNNKTEDDQAFSHSLKAKPYDSEIQLQDDHSSSLEPWDLIPCLSVPENEGCDGKTQSAALKRESGLVCFSPVITIPPLTHLLPTEDTSEAKQLKTRVINLQMAPDAASCDSKEDSKKKEMPKVRGPPPPVPKKPKNPLIKLKTAQLMSTDVKRRGKDNLHSEERVKRRHTFDFNKVLPRNIPANQDMCLLWDERGTYTVPTNVRRLSVGLHPWEHLSLKHMDDQYGDMIDFDYCERMEKQSADDEPPNLDMLQRRVFLERRSRYKGSPPPVAKKPSNPFASTETVRAAEVTSDKETVKPVCSGKREIYPELLSKKKVCTQVSNHANYGNRKDMTHHNKVRDAGSGSEVDSYKPVAEIVKETNQKHLGRAKSEGAKAQVQMTEQSVNVSHIKTTFDVLKKSKDRPRDVQLPSKKGETHHWYPLKGATVWPS